MGNIWPRFFLMESRGCTFWRYFPCLCPWGPNPSDPSHKGPACTHGQRLISRYQGHTTTRALSGHSFQVGLPKDTTGEGGSEERERRMEEPREANGGEQETSCAAESLSGDVWLAVLRHVDWHTLVAASATCRLLRQAATADSLWQAHWMDQYAQRSSYRMSSNEMGGCALRQCTDPQQEAARALQLLGASDTQPGYDSTHPQHQQGPSSAARSDRPTVGWKELFMRSREVDRGWATGRSTSEPLEGHNDFIRCMQLAGDTLVSCSGSVSHQDCSIRVWDLVNNSCKQVLRGHMGPIWCMMYEPTLNRIASGADDYSVRYWDSISGNSVVMEDPDSAVRCIHMDGAARQLVAGTEFGQLLLWDMDALEEVLSAGVDNVVQEYERLDQAKGGPRPLVVTGPGAGAAAARRVVALLDGRHVEVDGSNHVRAVDALDEGKAISAIQVQGGLCASTSIEPLSRIQLWDVSRNSWQLAATVGDTEMMFANSLSFEKSLNRLVAGCGDKNVRVWDLQTTQRLHLLTGHTDDIHAHQFDERTLASSSLNGQIRIWDMRSGHCRHVLQHSTALHAFQFDGDRLVSGTWDGRVCLWDMRKGSLVKEWYSHKERVWAVALDRYRIASAGLDQLINVRSFTPQQQQDDQAGGGCCNFGSCADDSPLGICHRPERAMSTYAASTQDPMSSTEDEDVDSARSAADSIVGSSSREGSTI